MLPRRAFDERENSAVCDGEIFLPDVRGGGERQAGRLSEMWHGSRICDAAGGASKAIYTCPMHPEIEEDKPGNCPICGMALELKTIAGRAEEKIRSSWT